MAGTVTKKDFFKIAKYFGWYMAFKVLFSRKPVALTVLMGIE
jgi:hypothetical protein